MKTPLRKLAWLGVLVISIAAVAATPNDFQTAIDGLNDWQSYGSRFPTFDRAEDIVDRWVENGRQFLNRNGQTFELFTHPGFTSYQLRITEPTICDSGVKQYSGYLDITTGKHLFFWFFESRHSPETADFIYWTNGGPGASSATGLLFELGPCKVASEGGTVTRNKYSWNTHSNILFLDQPVNVGWSYSDDGSRVSRSYVAGEDVYAFFQLFFSRFPEYAGAKFHMAAESYGGTYAPNTATVFHKKNRELEVIPVPGLKKINLASVILANGWTNPLEQYSSIPDWICEGPYALFDPESRECENLRRNVPNCRRLAETCYKFDTRVTCAPAETYCSYTLESLVSKLKLNPYDVRKSCAGGNTCYEELDWVETFMNNATIKSQLGVEPSRKFAGGSGSVYLDFRATGDGMRNSAPLLTNLVNNGIRLLVYAGNADSVCNYIGNERWLEKLESVFGEEFLAARPIPWITQDSQEVVGTVRSAGGDGFTAGNVTFVVVHEAGHMVPFDQPEAALDLITRWVRNVPLTN